MSFRKFTELGVQLLVMRLILEKNVSSACRNHGTQRFSHADTWYVQSITQFSSLSVSFIYIFSFGAMKEGSGEVSL